MDFLSRDIQCWSSNTNYMKTHCPIFVIEVMNINMLLITQLKAANIILILVAILKEKHLVLSFYITHLLVGIAFHVTR